jgi:hypothetical protein
VSLERCLACEAEDRRDNPGWHGTPFRPFAEDRLAATRRPRKRGSAPGMRV